MKTISQQIKFALFAIIIFLTPKNSLAQDPAAAQHQIAVAAHDRRCLDEASRAYKRTLELDPPRDLTTEEWKLAQTFAPRIYTHPNEFFALKDFAVIVHPTERLIAYHFFWADDVDFPEDNDPSDHELIWVQYSADKKSLEKIWSYFHGHILVGSEAALRDARAHAMRPRVNAQWGKHGSLLVGWEEMTVLQNNVTVTLQQYNENTFHQLQKSARLADHPLARRQGWPRLFQGTWENFTTFTKLIEPLHLLGKTKMAQVTRWNNATINQHFLPYNFRPKTEWPESDASR